MTPFITLQLPHEDGLVFINCTDPKMFGLTFVEPIADVIRQRSVDLMGARFIVDALVLAEEYINVGCVVLHPLDDKASSLFKSDTNKFQYLATEKVKIAFKAFMEEKPEAFEALKQEAK